MTRPLRPATAGPGAAAGVVRAVAGVVPGDGYETGARVHGDGGEEMARDPARQVGLAVVHLDRRAPRLPVVGVPHENLRVGGQRGRSRPVGIDEVDAAAV